MKAPSKKESANIIASCFPLHLFFVRMKVCLHPKAEISSCVAVSWRISLYYAPGYLYWHYDLSGLAARGVYPILMPKVSCFWAVNFIRVPGLSISLVPSLTLRSEIRCEKSPFWWRCYSEFRIVLCSCFFLNLVAMRQPIKYVAGNPSELCHHHLIFSLRISRCSLGLIERANWRPVFAIATSSLVLTVPNQSLE